MHVCVCVCLGVGAITIIMIIMHKLQNSAAGNQVTCVEALSAWVCVCGCVSAYVCLPVCMCVRRSQRTAATNCCGFQPAFSHCLTKWREAVHFLLSHSFSLPLSACVGACRFVLLTCRICIIEMKTHTRHSRAAARVCGSVCCVGLNQPHHYHYHYQRSGGRSRGRVRGSFICTANPH